MRVVCGCQICTDHPDACALAKDMHNCIVQSYESGFGQMEYRITLWDDTPIELRHGLIMGAQIFLDKTMEELKQKMQIMEKYCPEGRPE